MKAPNKNLLQKKISLHKKVFSLITLLLQKEKTYHASPTQGQQKSFKNTPTKEPPNRKSIILTS